MFICGKNMFEVDARPDNTFGRGEEIMVSAGESIFESL